MMKLNRPSYKFDTAIDLCKKGITGNPSLKAKVEIERPTLLQFEATYRQMGALAIFYQMTASASLKKSDSLVVGTLTKSDMRKLYTQYFVPEGKPARLVYDSIKNAAKDGCPFCGGIGTPKNVDHFLPKAHFPQFSILPLNLVPSCLDCNIGEKGDGYARTAEDQVIHPYEDYPHFFGKQWISARFHEESATESCYFEYFVDPPGSWSRVDKKRVLKHFQDFGIAGRYSKKAAGVINGTLRQIEMLQRKELSVEDINEALLKPMVDESPFVNHWSVGMYQALIKWLEGK